MPFFDVFYGIFIALIAPFLSIITSIFHKNYGYDIFHRIYGEYKLNMMIDFWSKTKGIQCVFKAIFDVIAIQIVMLEGIFTFKNSDFRIISGYNSSIA